MPDLRGLPLGAAQQILSDIGVTPSAITVTRQPAAGETGVVLTQQPVSGYDASGAVTLQVSTRATVPVVARRSATAVLSELEQLGAQVQSQSRYVPGVMTGQISRITPGPGSQLPERVQVIIATAPARLDLSSVDAVDYGCSSEEDLGLNGTAYPTGLTCSAYDEPTTQSYIANRGGDRVSGVLGVPDAENSSGTVHLTVRADGRVVGDYDAKYGATTTFSADVKGALRISFEVTGRGDDVSAGLGSLTLIGNPAVLDKLNSDD